MGLGANLKQGFAKTAKKKIVMQNPASKFIICIPGMRSEFITRLCQQATFRQQVTNNIIMQDDHIRCCTQNVQ